MLFDVLCILKSVGAVAKSILDLVVWLSGCLLFFCLLVDNFSFFFWFLSLSLCLQKKRTTEIKKLKIKNKKDFCVKFSLFYFFIFGEAELSKITAGTLHH